MVSVSTVAAEKKKKEKITFDRRKLIFSLKTRRGRDPLESRFQRCEAYFTRFTPSKIRLVKKQNPIERQRRRVLRDFNRLVGLEFNF